MKPAPFRYQVPTTLAETLAVLGEHGDDAKVLAGGQSLVPMLNFRLAAPALIVDLNRVAELAYIHPHNGNLVIGAMTRQRQVERDIEVAQRAPLIAETMPFIAHPQIRNRGTIGGSLAHADPAAELPAVMIALDARFKLCSQKREHWIAARDFFVGVMTTLLEPVELLVEIALPPRPPRTGWSFQEAARRHGDYALAGIATRVSLDKLGNCQDVRIVFVGLGGIPIEATKAAQLLKGQRPTDPAIEAASQAVNAEIDPSSDIHATSEFRRHLARVLTRRALQVSVSRAQGEPA